MNLACLLWPLINYEQTEIHTFLFIFVAKKLPKSDSGGQPGQRPQAGVRLNEQNQPSEGGCCK
jgi:hypothetical protein